MIDDGCLNIQAERTVSFTGHRPEKIKDGCSEQVQEELSNRLKSILVKYIEQGYDTFINGCMAGWDILAAEAVLELRMKYCNIRCITVAPFKLKFFDAPHWTKDWEKRALRVYCNSDIAFALSECYKRGIYYSRDRFLVENSSIVVCYFNGKPGGTKYTIDYAVKLKRKIINLAV